MKIYISSVFFILIFLSSQKISSQVLDAQTQKYESNKIQIFSPEERDNLYNWFEHRLDQMQLSEKIKEEYYSIILYYNVKMSRLDDKDKNLSKKQILRKLNKLMAKQDAEVQEILTSEQFKMHRDNYDRILQSIKKRIRETGKIRS